MRELVLLYLGTSGFLPSLLFEPIFQNMTLGAVEIHKVRNFLAKPGDSGVSLPAGGKGKVGPLSGKMLAARLKGLLSKRAVDRLERNIEASCEQIDD
jgi:hypothetical protein